MVYTLRDDLIYESRNNYLGGVYGLTQRLIAYNSVRMDGGKLTMSQIYSMTENGVIYDETGFNVDDVTTANRSFIILRNELMHMNDSIAETSLHDVLSAHIEACRKMRFSCTMLIDLFIRCLNAGIYPAIIHNKNASVYIDCINNADISTLADLFYAEQEKYNRYTHSFLL